MKKLVLFLFFLPIILLFACFDDDKDDIKVIVTCTSEGDASFTGSYELNDKDTVDFTSSALSNVETGNMHIYEKKFDNVDDLTVSASKSNADSVLSVQIFRNDEYVKSVSSDYSGSTTVSIEFDYDDD